MKAKSGLAWESELLLNRYLEDCGVQCELVTPHMLAAPYYRGKFVSLVIPTGFGNPRYSNLLPALRASSARLKRFVEKGGRLLVFGAMALSPDTYDWLLFPVRYTHEYFSTEVRFEDAGIYSAILDDFKAGTIECDGYFTEFEGRPVATAEDGRVLMIRNPIGAGEVLVTSFHEYPSKEFLKQFCTGDTETLF
jgi:hypothetical protein